MLSLPTSWPLWSVWTFFAGLLAGLDVAMSLAGTMAVRTRGTPAMGGWVVLGVALSLALFWAAASSLTYGDMLEMNVLWIAALMLLVPITNSLLNGQRPSLRVLTGIALMIAAVSLIQWPGGSEAPDRRAGSGTDGSTVDASLEWLDTALVTSSSKAAVAVLDIERTMTLSTDIEDVH